MKICSILCGFFCFQLACKNGEMKTDYVISANIDTSKIFSGNPNIADSIWNRNPEKINKAKRSLYDSFYNALFNHNIAMVWMEDNNLHDSSPRDTFFIPAVCQYTKSNDTIHITASVGFFGGYLIDISIREGKYFGQLTEIAQNPLFAIDTITKQFNVKEITVKAASQSLLLNKIPDFKAGEKIFGEYSATFKPYYENNMGIAKKEIKVRTVFRCNLF